MAKSKPYRKPTTKHRSSWKGQLSFGLVSFPVEAFNALDRDQSDIHVHQVHAKCHRRIHYQKTCPVHGEVPNDEIVSAYETQKGKYVEIDPDELGALRSPSERALKIDAFVSPDIVDPIYFDGRMYYIVPAGTTASEPYGVIVEAMEREKRYGIRTVVFSGKGQIVLLRPLDGVLHMAMLNYDAEMRPAKTVAASFTKPKSIARQVRLAQTLIEEWSDDNFNFSKYEDTYRERVEELIAAKSRGRKLTTPKDEEPAEVLNLMDALKRSMTTARGKKSPKRAARRTA